MATDPTGYSTPLSYPYEVIIDTHAPQPPQLNDISPDTGLSSTDGITDVNTPTFSGTTEPFAVVEPLRQREHRAVRGDGGRHLRRLVLHGRSAGTGHLSRCELEPPLAGDFARR